MITRREILVASVCTLATATIALLAQTAASKPMRSQVFQWDNLKVEPTKTGERRNIVDAPTVTLARFESHVTTLEPGQAPHAPHRHTEEELLVVKEGTIEAMQEGRTNLVTAGGMIFEGSNEFHGLRNSGTNRASYYVIKWYPHDLEAKGTQKTAK